MRFSLSLPALRDPGHAQPYHESYALARLAESLGFDTATVGHHHFMPGNARDPITWMTAVAAQTEQVFRNIHRGEPAVGAGFADVVKLTIYVRDYTPDKMEAFVAGVVKASRDLGIDSRRPATLIGVAALASPDYLLEIEAMAVLPG